jgi:hypothetical protein
MERDSVITHGMAEFLKESYMKRSDGTTMWVCNGCGQIPIYNEDIQLFVCPTCDGPLEFQGNSEQTLSLVVPIHKSRTTFSRVEIPYALKLMDQELQTFASMGMRFVTDKYARRFRDPALVETAAKDESASAEGSGAGFLDLFMGAGAAAGAGAVSASGKSAGQETPKMNLQLQGVVETLSKQINELNERLTVARLPTEQLSASETSNTITAAETAAAPSSIEPAAAATATDTSTATVSSVNSAAESANGAAAKLRLPTGAAARMPLPPTEAYVLLTRPNIAQTIQENEEAVAAAEAAKLAATAPTTVNVVLNSQQQQQPPAAPALVPLGPQSGGGEGAAAPGGKQPTLEIFEVSTNEGQDNIAAISEVPEIKVLNVTAFDSQPKK